jgi:uncharacterized protein DUF262
MSKRGHRADLEKISDDDIAVPFKYDIASYGADFPVDTLVSRLDSKALFIPDFQRGFVWSQTQASRFIESLLLGIPVPGVFLAKDNPTSRLLVVDGQQRLRTLQYFFTGTFPKGNKPFALTGVQREFLGLTYEDLSTEDRRRLADCIIHATIVQQTSPSDDQSSVYYIFERINTNNTPLTPQEIRACIYNGPFIDLLAILNKDPHWRSVFGKVNPRLRDQELILRFIALYHASNQYDRPMRSFLNRYIGQNRFISKPQATEITELFTETITLADNAIARPFRLVNAINAAVYDSVMIGLARRIASGSTPRLSTIVSRYDALLEDHTFLENVERATADEESLKSRLTIATEFFAK